MSWTKRSGFIEPLHPPMRNPLLCDLEIGPKKLPPHDVLMSMRYLIHDFEYMCQQLKPHSKRILIDMGASLSFHARNKMPPLIWLLNLYETFGFQFDHIYGFELKFTDPETVYKSLLPEKYIPNYHWINVGVNASTRNKLNPLHSILSKFDEDDFIVVKLDVDTPSVELPITYQILSNEMYWRRIDQFYFEHHVHLKELQYNWGKSMNGTIYDTLHMFTELRKRGVPAHFWP